MTNDDLIVTIPDDIITFGQDEDGLPKTVPTAKAREPRPDPVAKAEPKVNEVDLEAAQRRAEDAQARADGLAKTLETERAAREKAEQESGKDRGIAMRAHMTTLHTRAEQFESGALAARSAVETLKQDIERASTEGDHKRIADLMEKLAEAKGHESTYATAHSRIKEEIDDTTRRFEGAAPAEKDKPKVVEAEPDKTKPPTPDEWIGTCPKTTQPWLKEHKEFAQDPRKNRQLLRFVDEWLETHNDDRYSLDTKAFVKALDEKFFPDTDEEVEMAKEPEPTVMEPEEEAPKRTAPKRAVSSAPVSRSSDVFSSRNPSASQVKLPPKLAQFVRETGLNYEKYALQTVADIKAGKLPKNFLDHDYPHE